MAVSESISLSLTGLVGYMTGSATAQRSTLRNFKYPDPESAARIQYYDRTRKAITKYHRRDHAASWLIGQAGILRAEAQGEEGYRRTRLRHNARTLEAYARHFADRQFEIRTIPKLRLSYGRVSVSTFADLFVFDGKLERLIKFNFSEKALKEEEIKIVAQAMYESAERAGMDLKPAQVLYYDLATGEIHKGARMGARMGRDITATCENIAAIWDSI